MAAGEWPFPDDLAAKVLEARRAIHANPELSHEERETAALVRHELEAAGIGDIASVFTTGLVATIHGRRPRMGRDGGRTLALRADMDALPIQERRPLPFASRNAGVMHACGHDAHTAILLGVSLALHRARDQFEGTVRCIFQPAEEAEPLGAREVLKAGHLEGVEGILALHVDPDLPAGTVGVHAGALLAGGQEFTVRVRGRAAHGARPHQGIDAIVAAAAVVQQLQTIPSRRIDPLDPVVVTVGRIEGGTARNIIAEEVRLDGTFRVLDEGLRGEVERLIREVAEGAARAHGAEAVLETKRGEPVLVNDRGMTDLVRRAAADVLGTDKVVEVERPSMGSEDFAYYVERVPGAMFRLGVRNEALGFAAPIHHPEFGIDERSLPVGAAVMLESARRFLDRRD